ncbi:MAG: hypothetical protein CMK09_07660 [Ponticaulis sp.]|nr:hypothetical protein [Ponticaulis sp.]|tara:strand:+ start:61751 stop:62422 length:672 start_codon:yes stop_codon:yes gene_type:complete
MTVAFFAQTESQSNGHRPFRSRFEACMKLPTGEIDFPVTRVDPLFEDQPIVGVTHTSPGHWLADCIARLGQAARQFDVGVRPLHVPMPLAILQSADTPDQCLNAVKSQDCCPQEFILEFQDSTLAQTEDGVLDRMEAFRRKGFRIGLDARRSSESPFGARLRSAVERMRVTEFDLMNDDNVQMRAEIVSGLGGDVILDRASWKNVDLLKSFGATHAQKLIADA